MQYHTCGKDVQTGVVWRNHFQKVDMQTASHVLRSQLTTHHQEEQLCCLLNVLYTPSICQSCMSHMLVPLVVGKVLHSVHTKSKDCYNKVHLLTIASQNVAAIPPPQENIDRYRTATIASPQKVGYKQIFESLRIFEIQLNPNFLGRERSKLTSKRRRMSRDTRFHDP